MPIVLRLAAVCAMTVHVTIHFPFQILDVLVATVPVVRANVGGISEEHESTGQGGNKARLHHHFRPDHKAPPQVRLIALGWPGLPLTLGWMTVRRRMLQLF
jgi:hypothetical protein